MALKSIEFAKTERENVEREVETMGRVQDHQNIVRLVECFFLDESTLCIVTECCQVGAR